MTDLKKTLYAFWSQFGVPAYLRDQVPKDAKLPYITYDVTRGSLASTTVLTAFNWHKREGAVNQERTELMDKISKAIPEGGCVLPCGNGYLHLFRNPADFQMDWQDEQDQEVIGGRTSYEVHFYVK